MPQSEDRGLSRRGFVPLAFRFDPDFRCPGAEASPAVSGERLGGPGGPPADPDPDPGRRSAQLLSGHYGGQLSLTVTGFGDEPKAEEYGLKGGIRVWS
jgi:hypothetical protein